MAQAGGYREELESELKQTDPNSHANRLIAQEIERLTKGEDDNNKKEKPSVPLIEIHNDRPQKISAKVRIPIREHPRYNFVGKLLGPKGQTLKALQEQTGCKMAIMGRGSMREKDKEEELRKEGGKYAHLHEDLHVLVDCFSEASDAYHRVAAGLAEVRKFLIPELADDMYGGGDMGMGEMGMNGGGGGGAPRGRGSFRGGPPPERGGRGGFRGRGAGGPPGGAPPAGRGAPPPSGRGGAPPQRGAPRGAPAGRGAPPSRGARAAAPPPPAASSYDGYNSQGYGSGGYNSQYDGSYDDGYSASRGGGADSSYYDYGASNAAPGYDSYSQGGGGYGDYGDGYQAKAAPPPSSRGAARPPARAHPYARPSQGGY